MLNKEILREIAENFISTYLCNKLELVNWRDYDSPREYISRIKEEIGEVLNKLYASTGYAFPFRAEVRINHKDNSLHWNVLIYDQGGELIFDLADYNVYYGGIDPEYALEDFDTILYGIEKDSGA